MMPLDWKKMSPVEVAIPVYTIHKTYFQCLLHSFAQARELVKMSPGDWSDYI